MKNRIASLLCAVVFVTAFPIIAHPTTSAAATQQSLTLLGGQTDATHPFGGYSQEADVSSDTGTTWVPAYLTNSHPWTVVAGTNAWLSGCPRTDDAACLNRNFIFRHRFFVASDFETATVTYEMNVDDVGQFFLNGLTSANQLFSPHTGNSTFASHKFGTNQNVQNLLVPGWNTFYVVLTGLSGHVGINYKTVLNYYSVEPPIYQAPVGRPGTPTIGTPTIVDSTTVSVPFSPPASDGGSPITSYRVTSYPHGRTGTSPTSPITISGLTTGSPETFTVVAITNFGTSDSSTASSVITPRDRFTVSFNSQGGSSISSASYFTNESVTAPSAPTRGGYNFRGWFETATATNQVSFPYSYSIPGDFTLYAQWEASISSSPDVIKVQPSSIKMIARPRISRSDSFITCNSGEYRFTRNARSEESLTATSQAIRLLSNGLVVDSSTAISQLAQFSKSEAYENSTLSCEVAISQEGITSTQSSIDNDSIKLLESAKVKQISQANYDYYKARDNAYLNRIEGSATSAATWKKALEKAISAREAQKVKASSDFIASLEADGISILYITKAKEVTPEPALPVVEKEPPVANVQPSKAMKKIGTIYFATGTYFINDASRKVLKELASVIADSDPSTLLSYGHTDSKGGTNNLLLSQNRAKAVARVIQSFLPDQKIKTGWYAASKPVSSGSSKADLAKNRRVEIYIN
ncbi:Listeria/Bacterioides repeat [Candidatus Nanopelagicaceae bacterium]